MYGTTGTVVAVLELVTFFTGWEPIGRTLLACVIAYVAVVLCVRIAGKRTLAQMDEFDLAVTVAVGSVIATMMLSPDVSIVQGIAAMIGLVVLQVLGTFAMSRSRFFQRMLENEPTLLLREGRMLSDAMRQTRVTDSEVLQAIRSHGSARWKKSMRSSSKLTAASV